MKGTFSQKAATGYQIEVIVNQFRKKSLFLMEHHSTQRKCVFNLFDDYLLGGWPGQQESAFDFI